MERPEPQDRSLAQDRTPHDSSPLLSRPVNSSVHAVPFPLNKPITLAYSRSLNAQPNTAPATSDPDASLAIHSEHSEEPAFRVSLPPHLRFLHPGRVCGHVENGVPKPGGWHRR